MDLSGGKAYEGMQPIRVDEITGLYSYLKTIDWREPWFQGLLLFHVLCLVSTVLTRRKPLVQAFIFISMLASVYMSEYINEFAAKNWRKFARQQYFDSKGLFISVVFSTPILFNSLIIVVMWMYNTGLLLKEVIRLKGESAKRRQKREKEEEEKKTD